MTERPWALLQEAHTLVSGEDRPNAKPTKVKTVPDGDPLSHRA